MNLKQVKPIILLLAVFILLCGVFAVLYLSKDKMPPVLTISQEPLSIQNTGSALSEENKQLLLAGVTAKDQQDGDLTANVVVDQFMPISGQTIARVRYLVRDAAGNMASAIREVQFSGDIGAATQPAATPTPTPEKTPQATADPTPTATPATNPALPTIVLFVKEAAASMGEPLYLLDFVQTVGDDVDDMDYLYRHISIAGEANIDYYTPGTYTVSFYVTDSQGNDSLPAPFQVKVG